MVSTIELAFRVLLWMCLMLAFISIRAKLGHPLSKIPFEEGFLALFITMGLSYLHDQ